MVYALAEKCKRQTMVNALAEKGESLWIMPWQRTHERAHSSFLCKEGKIQTLIMPLQKTQEIAHSTKPFKEGKRQSWFMPWNRRQMIAKREPKK